ncbi:unnamed protein product [Scytosiphon promiscuus]
MPWTGCNGVANLHAGKKGGKNFPGCGEGRTRSDGRQPDASDSPLFRSTFRTPLHLACWAGKVGMIELLLKHRADCMAEAQDSFTPLHFCSQAGCAEGCRMLLAAGAEVNAKLRKTKKTPLHFAAGKGHVEAVRVLMQAGADTSAETSKGQTPLLLANKPEVKAALSGEAPPLAPPLSPPASEAAAPSAAAATAAVATKERIEGKPSEEAGGTDRENQGSPGKPAAEGKGVGSGESQTAEHVAKGRGSAGGKAERAGSLAERRRKKRKLAEAAAAAGKGVSLDHLDGDE